MAEQLPDGYLKPHNRLEGDMKLLEDEEDHVFETQQKC